MNECASCSGTDTSAAVPDRTSIRGCSRASGVTRGITSPFSRRNRSGATTWGSRHRAAGRRRTAARLRPRPLRRLRRPTRPGLHASRARTVGGDQRRRHPWGLPPADVVFTNDVLLGGPVGDRRVVRAVRCQRARLRARVLDARQRGAVGVGGRRRWVARATFVGSEHIRTVVADVCGHTTNVIEVPPGVDIDEWAPELTAGGRCRTRRGGVARCAESSATPRSDFPTTATRSASGASASPGPPVVVYFGQADRAEGCARPHRRRFGKPGRAGRRGRSARGERGGGRSPGAVLSGTGTPGRLPAVSDPCSSSCPVGSAFLLGRPRWSARPMVAGVIAGPLYPV